MQGGDLEVVSRGQIRQGLPRVHTKDFQPIPDKSFEQGSDLYLHIGSLCLARGERIEGRQEGMSVEEKEDITGVKEREVTPVHWTMSRYGQKLKPVGFKGGLGVSRGGRDQRLSRFLA